MMIRLRIFDATILHLLAPHLVLHLLVEFLVGIVLCNRRLVFELLAHFREDVPPTSINGDVFQQSDQLTGLHDDLAQSKDLPQRPAHLRRAALLVKQAQLVFGERVVLGFLPPAWSHGW